MKHAEAIADLDIVIKHNAKEPKFLGPRALRTCGWVTTAKARPTCKRPSA